ncbi:YraN family protein [Gilliamella sp. B3791]|uniref:YraN family protein n=1 Tax=unclassified Gilliamella TaxID=2685620 RepID=UPI00226A0B10|nr:MULTISPECIES: YraN family protein [unclassified Gilliamella]MCX8643030.1 YraN family protein [Gilliamella sp. B3835]MCX8708421.1 YraN family protein [Gilliamella sp. B3783]MCX8709903.1 YraN family protein [Gilliamella sp. B3780]MCX8717617.1 YraN family protein [Gilliamella sp. B3784]MCX8719953.1 YraN family protein [Gilliamella sp. B3788]
MVQLKLPQQAKNKQIGKHYENIACQYLLKQGLLLIAKNSQYPLGEVDLIMQDKQCLVFVEVRYRKNANFGDAAMTVTLSKQTKIKQAAQLWMLSENLNIEDTEFRFDIFAVTGKNQQWIINAF